MRATRRIKNPYFVGGQPLGQRCNWAVEPLDSAVSGWRWDEQVCQCQCRAWWAVPGRRCSDVMPSQRGDRAASGKFVRHDGERRDNGARQRQRSMKLLGRRWRDWRSQWARNDIDEVERVQATQEQTTPLQCAYCVDLQLGRAHLSTPLWTPLLLVIYFTLSSMAMPADPCGTLLLL